MAIGSLVQQYLLWLDAAGYAPDTVRTRRASLRRFVRWLTQLRLGHVGDITPAVLERYRQFARLRQNGGQPTLTPGSQVQALLAMKRFLAWCVGNGAITSDPVASFTLPRRPQQLPRAVLSAGEAEALLAQPDVRTGVGIRDRAILELLYSTGSRRGELAALKRADLDSERSTLWIRRGKGGRQRVVPIGWRALAWVHRYAARVRPRFARDPADDTLFLSC